MKDEKELTFGTTLLHEWLKRHRDGDAAAADALIRGTCSRLERLARKMLRDFPNVSRHAQTDDVLQNALLRLLRALERIEPPSMRDFYNLAARLMRCELLDLARHYRQANRHEAARLDRPGDTSDAAVPEPRARADESRDLVRWARFHEDVEKLPAAEREVVGLIFYHGWTQAQVAELFGVTVRTVQRYWQAALVRLHGLLQQD